MNWVDLMGDVRWSELDLENRARNELSRDFPDAAELQQRVGAFAAGVGLMTEADRGRLDAISQARAALRTQVEAEFERDALLGEVQTVEAAMGALRALPPVPEDGHDPDAEQRIGLQAIIDGADPEVSSLVVQRNRYPAPQEAA